MRSACGYCRRLVDYGEGLYDDGIWYHDRCYYILLKKECDKYETKARRGTITLDESERYHDIRPLCDKVLAETRKPSISFSDIMSESVTPVFIGKSEGLCKIAKHSRQLIEHKQKHPQIAGADKKLIGDTNASGKQQ